MKRKKQNTQKMCVMKIKLKFEIYYLEGTQLDNKIYCLEKTKIYIETFFFFYYKRKHKEFIKNIQLILKTQQRFKSENHNFFKEINKIVLSTNDDKKMQSVYLTETYTYGKRKYLVGGKEEIKYKNTIKRYKND